MYDVKLRWPSIYTYGFQKLRPYIARHEPEIDRNLLELRTRVGDMVVVNWTKAAAYGQTRPRNQGTRVKRAAVSENGDSEQQKVVLVANSKPETSQPEHKTTPTPPATPLIIQKEATQVTQTKPRQRRVNSGR